VQALRTYDDTLTATYWVNVRDAAGATSGEPVTVVIHGANDAPVSVAVGNRFDGTSASVVAGTPLGASANFSFELTVSPKDSISLKTASTTGTAGTSGQKYALSPTQGEVAWGSAAHAGIGLSVGVNGISVYQHSSNLLSSLLTWTGTVTENTHVAVNVIDNTPSLFINNVLVGTGLQSTKLLHPPTEVGGISHGYFSGSIHDVRVWNQPFLWQASGSPDVQPQYEKLALAIAENAAGGSVVTRLSATDLDTGDTLTYSLIEDGGGLFQVNASTGEVYLAPGATPDHETASSITLRARATDSGGLFKDISFSVRITNVNEAPTSWGGEATMNEDNQVRLALTRVADLVVNGQTVPAVRIDTLPAGGQLTLDGQPVAAGQVVSASDAVRMVFKPVLFSTAAFNMNDVDAGDSISAVRITALPDPAQGRLLLNGVELSQETLVVHAHDFSQLTFEPVPNFNGHASFTYRVIDSHGVQQGGDASTFTIHINPVNDAPTIQPTLTIEVQEGSSTRLQGLQVNDVDAGTAEISITLKVESGLLSAASAAGVTVMGSGSTELVLRGTVSALNSMLASEPGVSYAADLYPATDLNLQLQGVLDDGQGDPVYRATFTTPAGSLGALNTAGLTIVGDGSGLLSIEGKASVLGPYLLGQNVTRTMPMTTHQLTVVVNDNGAMGLDPGLTGNDGSEQDVRTVGLTVVPLGLSLLQPEQLDAAFTHPSGPGPDGLGSAAGIAGLPLEAPLVLALGDVNRITSPVGSGEAEQLAANQEWNELHENLHPSGFNERHEWKENVNWLPPSGTVAPDGTYDVVPPDLTPNLAANPFILIPFIVYGTMEAAYLFLTYHEPEIRPTHIPDPEVRPWIQGPDETLTLNEDQSVEITDFTFYNPSEGNRASVWVRFSLMEGGGVLSANTGADARVAVANNHSDALMLIGNVDAINELIHTGGVTFTPDPHVEGVLHLDVTISRGLSGPLIGESTTIAGLVINPTPDAPEGTDATFVVDHGTSFLLTPDRFGFSDVDGDDFMGVKITELPDSGQLLLNGVPVEAGQVINMQALMSYNLAYAPDAALTGAPVHPRIGFQVMDSGSTSNIGAVNHLSLNVQYPTVLEPSQAAAQFNEASGQPLHWLSGVALSNRSSIDPRVKTIRITAEGAAFGDEWTIDPVWLHALQGVLPFERIEVSDGVSELRFTWSATLGFVESLLGALVFDVQSPNATEGTRQFSVKVIGVDGLESPALGVEVGVTSILGELTREVEAAQAAMQARADAGPLPPTAEVAAADAQASWALLQARAALAQAVAQALSEAIPTSDGGLQMGTSLDLALRTLGLGQGTSLVFSITEPTAEEVAGDWLSRLIRDPATDTLWLPGEQRLALLAWAEGERSEALQWAAAQFMAAIDSPIAITAEGELLPSARKVPAGAWLLDALAQSVDPAWQPDVVHGNDPWAVWAVTPHAWVQDVEGNLYLNDAAWHQLKMSAEVQLVSDQDDSGSPELLAIQALQSAAAMGDHWLVDTRVLGWLATAGLSMTVVPDNGEGSRPWLTQPGVLVQTAEGLLMAPPTLLDLQVRLLESLDAAGSGFTSAQSLFAALQALVDSEAVPTLPAEARAWLDSLDLGVRWVTDLSAAARPGEIAQSGAGAPLVLSAATVDALYARLVAREVADAIKGEGSQATGPVGSDLLEVKRTLEQAQTSQISDKLHVVAASEVVLAWLNASGQPVASTAGYQALGMNDALSRMMERPNVALFEPLTNTLHLSDAVYRRLGAVAGVALESALGTDPAQTGPLAPSPSAPTVEERHADAVRPGAGDLIPAEQARLWLDSLAAVNLLVGPGTSTSPVLSETAPVGVRLLNETFAANAVDVLANAGVAVRDLGDWSALSSADRAALSDANQPALARDALGQPFMNEAVMNALQSRLVAQAFGERAELALTAIELLTAAPGDTALPVIEPNGVVSTSTSALSLVDPTDVVVTLSRADLLRLQHLGLEPVSVEVVDGYLTPEQVDALQNQPGLVVVDQRHGSVWIHEATRASWLQTLADTMQASRVARYATDPASIELSAHAGQPVGMAYAVSLTGPTAVAWTSSPAGEGLVRISLDVGTLLAAHLAFRTMHADSGHAATLSALAQARIGTVMTDAAQPGTVVMTTGTWSALLAQSERISDSLADWSNGVPDAAAPLLTALLGRTVLEDAFDDDSTGFVWMNNHAALLSALQAAGVSITAVGFGSTSEPPVSLLDQLKTYAVTGDRLVASEATWNAWRTAVLAHANQLGAPAYEEAPWQSATPAVMHDTQATSSATAAALETAQTQLAALLVDGRRESVTIDQQSHALWHIHPLEQRLDAAAMRFILQASNAAFDWFTMPAGDNSLLSSLVGNSYPTVVEAADGSLYFTGAGLDSAVAALRARMEVERDKLSDHLQSQLLHAQTAGDRVLLPAVAVPGDWQVLLGDAAPLLKMGSSHPKPGEIAIDQEGRVWLHEHTRLGLLSELGNHQSEDAGTASTLLALLNEASSDTGMFDVWSVHGDALAMLQSLGLGSRITGVYDGTVIGLQNLGEAADGSYLLGADTRVYVTGATLAALQALSQGRVNATPAATDQTTIAEVALLNYLSELNDHTLANILPAPVSGSTGQMDGPALWHHLKHWIVLEGPGSQTTGLQDQVGLPANWLSLLQSAAPVRLLTLGTDNGLLAALQSGELHHEHVIVKDAAGNHLMSPATRGLVMEWIANGLTHATGLDWSAQFGLQTSLVNVEQASSKRALLDQQQPDSTDPALYTVSGTVLAAVLTAQNSTGGNGTSNAVHINLTGSALASWLLAIDQRGLYDLNLAEVQDPAEVADGQFAEDGNGVVVTEATARQLYNAATGATQALALDNADSLLQQISSRAGYEVVNGFVVVEASPAFDIWRQSTDSFNLTQARDVNGLWHEVAFEPLQAVQAAWLDALAAGTLSQFMASATNVTLANNSTVALRNADLLSAYDQLTERGQGFSRNADGNWVMSDDTREWLITEAATVGTGARMAQADRLAAQLTFALDHADGNGTISLNKADAIELFDQLDIPYLLSLNPADVTLPHRLIDMGDNTVLLSTESGDTFAALAASARNDGLGTVQQRLATLNDAEPIYNEAQFVARLSDVDLLPSVARHDKDPAKLLVSIALDATVWARFGLGDAGSTSLPIEGPLSAANQNDWDALWQQGSVRAYTDAEGGTRYLMTSETWSTLLEEVDTANPGGSLTAVVRLSAEDINGVDVGAIGGLTVVSLADLPGAQGSGLLQFAKASALVQSLPALTVLRDADGNLWMSTNTANAAKAVLRGQLNAASLGLDTPTMESSLLGAQLAALDLAQTGLALAKTAQVYNGGTWSGHALTQADLSDLEQLGLPLQQVSGTDPSQLTFASAMSYVVDAQNRVWVSEAGYAKIATLVDATDHALNTELHALRWQAVPGQGLWTLGSDSHFDLLLQRSPLSLVNAGTITASTDLSQLAPGSYVRDTQGRVYVSDATHTLVQKATEPVAVAERAQFQSSVQASLMASTVDTPATLVFVTESDLFWRIVQNPRTESVSITSDLNALSAADREALAAPGKYTYAQVNGGLLIGLGQLQALTALTTGGIGEVNASQYTVQEVLSVVVNREPMLGDWLTQLGYRFGSIVDAQGNAVPAAQLDVDNLSDVQRAQLNQETGLIVQGANGQLLMSDATWQAVMTRSMTEANASQSALALDVQRALGEATVQDIEGTQVATLSGDAKAWLAEFDSLGMAYHLVDALGTPTNADALNPQALVTTGNTLPVGIDSQGQLVMSEATLQRLSDWSGEFAQVYSLNSALLQAQGAAPGDITNPAHSFGNTQTYLLGDWQGATAGIRLMYSTITAIRSLMNQNMAADGVVKGQLSKIINDLAKFNSAELSTYINEHGNELTVNNQLNALAINRYRKEVLGNVEYLVHDDDANELEMGKIATHLSDDYIRSASGLWKVVSNGMLQEVQALIEGNPVRANLANDAIDMLGMFLEDAQKYRQENLAIYQNRVDKLAAEHAISVNTPRAALADEMERLDLGIRRAKQIIDKYYFADVNSLAPTQVSQILSQLSAVASDFSDLLTNDVASQVASNIDQKVGAKVVTDMLKTIQGTPEYIDLEAIGKASNAFQSARLLASKATFFTQSPAALADAVNLYKLWANTYTGTEEGARLAAKYASQGGLALSAMAGGIFSSAQLPTWAKFKTQADLDQYWKDMVSPGTYSARNFILTPAGDGLPMQDLYKQTAAHLAGADKINNGKLGVASNVQPNIVYQLADWAGTLGAFFSSFLWSRQTTPWAYYQTGRNAVAGTFSGIPLALGDGMGSGIIAYWLYKALNLDKEAYGKLLYSTGSEGGRSVGFGQFTGSMALPALDALVATGLYAGYGSKSGLGWGSVADSWWSTAATGFATVALNYGVRTPLALLPTYVKIDFSSIQNAILVRSMLDKAWEQERDVEAAILERQFGMDVMKAIPLVNLFGGAVGLIESIVGSLGQNLGVSSFKTAVEQRVAALENHPDEGQDPLSQRVLQQALLMGTADRHYDIANQIDDFTFAQNGKVKVMKSVVVSRVVDGVVDTTPDVHFYDTDAEIEGVASGNNLAGRHVINVELANTSGGLATYLIRPEAQLHLADINLDVPAPLMRIDASGSEVDSTNQFYIFNNKVTVLGGQGEDLYLLNESLRPQINAAGTDLIAGFIRDGINSLGRDGIYRPGRDAASWMLAASTDTATKAGHSIHTGTGAEGFAVYRGIQHFHGSNFNDVFTRYGATSVSRVQVTLQGGGGSDVFDLRSGNNDVKLSSGEVRFNNSGLTSAQANNRDTLVGEGVYSDAPYYAGLFGNHFDADNFNAVQVDQSRSSGLVKVYGHADSHEALWVDFGDQGLRATFKTDATNIDGTSFTNRYEVENVSTVVGGATLRVVANGNIDSLWGTAFADQITVGQGATLKEIHGGGGNDTIDVNVGDVFVGLSDGNSLVKLGGQTSGTTLALGEGNEAKINTAADATDKAVTVNVFGGAMLDTHVDASASDETINLHALTGRTTFMAGLGSNEVRVNETALAVDVVANALGGGSLKLILEDDNGFSVNDLITDDGQVGKFLRTVVNGNDVYSTNWRNDLGVITELTLHGSSLSGGTLVSGTYSKLLSELIAEPAPVA